MTLQRRIRRYFEENGGSISVRGALPLFECSDSAARNALEALADEGMFRRVAAQDAERPTFGKRRSRFTRYVWIGPRGDGETTPVQQPPG